MNNYEHLKIRLSILLFEMGGDENDFPNIIVVNL